MDRSVWNRGAKMNRIGGALVRYAGAFLLLLMVLVVLLVMFVPWGYAQNVSLRNVPGASIAAKITKAQTDNCSSSTGVTCVIVIEPELSVFSTGTLPTRCATCTWVDYRTAGKVLVNGIDIGAGGALAAGSDIQAAITACSSPCHIFLGPGNFTVASTLTSANKVVNLEGAGRDVTIVTTATNQHGWTIDTTSSGSRLAHLSWYGTGGATTGSGINSGAAAACTTIAPDACTHTVTIEDVHFKTWAIGVNTGAYSADWKIVNNYAEAVTGDAFFLAQNTTGNTVTGNTCQSTGSMCVDVNGSYNTITSNHAKNAGTNAAWQTFDRSCYFIAAIATAPASDANGNILSNNTCETAAGNGITVRGDTGHTANANVITKNQITGAGQDGIAIDGSSPGTLNDNTVEGNTVRATTRYGVLVDGQNATAVLRTKVRQNDVTGSGTKDIFLAVSVTNTELTYNNNAAVLQDDSASTILPSAGGGLADPGGNGLVKRTALNTTAVATAADIPATTLATGTSVSLSAPREYYVCTSTCTVTPPVPAAGYEFCVLNGDNVATVITMAALGSSAFYENTARTAYGTAGTGTMVSSGAIGDRVCLLGLDATHYITSSFNGSWTVN